MRDNTLYFPFISIPESKWITRVLLYWAQISSIVPFEYAEKPELHSEFMLNLVREGLVQQVFPQQYLHAINDFESAFINYITGKIHQRKRYGYNQNAYRNKSLVHIEKLGELPQWLEDHDLAERIDYSWYAIDDWVAAPFMAYLANVLGSIKDVNAAPVTDKYFLSNYYQIHKKETQNHNESRDYILKHLLPYPEKNVSLDSLIRFKQDYGYLLPKLRGKIETYSAELSLIENRDEWKARADSIISDCKDDIAEIHEQMSISWKKVVFGSIIPLVGAGGAVYATDPTQNALAAGAAGFSFLAATYQAISNIPTENTVKYKPLAYLAFAEKKFKNA